MKFGKISFEPADFFGLISSSLVWNTPYVTALKEHKMCVFLPNDEEQWSYNGIDSFKILDLSYMVWFYENQAFLIIILKKVKNMLMKGK